MPQQCEKLSSLGALSSKFSNLKVISGGSGGIVLSAVDKQPSQKGCPNVALKRLSLVGKSQCRVALRELRLLKRFCHDNVVKTYKITDPSGCTIEDPSMENFKDLDSVFVVEELLDSDLHKIIEKNRKLPLETAKLFMYQLLRGLKYIHSANVIHRDIKPGNLFVKGEDLTLKIGDYGLARVFDQSYNHKGYLTAVVSTRYYRAPEVIVSLGDYSFAIDIWSAGCVFGELLLGKVLFPGVNDLDQINVIKSAFSVKGDNIFDEETSFPQHWLEDVPPEALDLISKLLCLDPKKRITANEALEHPFFSELHDPLDEPICEHSFHIEHEIDNLPIKILKRKILRNSCLNHIDTKQSYHSSEENLFKDFDETFIHSDNVNKPKKSAIHISLNSRGDDTDLSDNISSPFAYNSSNEIICSSYESHISQELPFTKNIRDNVKNTYLPTIDDVMSCREDIIDAPCRDPGVCERKYHNSIKLQNDLDLADRFTQNSYFSELSPVIEMSEQPKQTNNSNQSFLENHGRYCADRASFENFNKVKKKKSSIHNNNNSKLKFDNSISSSSKQSEIKSLNEEILSTLQKRHWKKDCTLQDLITGKMNNSHPMVHWDSIRFWI